MFAKRALVTVILLPIGLLLIHLGGLAYSAFIALILCLAAWEFIALFRTCGMQPAGVLVLAGVLLVTGGRYINGFASAPWIITLLILASMTYHLFAYESGRNQAGTDFLVTLGGVLYVSWLGAYLISLRELPDGKWWLLLVLPSVWLADTGAYFIGSRFGRRKLSPRLSPKKTWEGYLAGVVAGTAGGILLAQALQALAGPLAGMTPLAGGVIGLGISMLTTLGDLGESMIKRQVGAKDSGNLLPGHGGVFDRIDSWLWAAPIGYYLIVWLFLPR